MIFDKDDEHLINTKHKFQVWYTWWPGDDEIIKAIITEEENWKGMDFEGYNIKY